jgi:hypothetical protein|tara:strand:- start:3892 stop:4560 length:669 start_codon:yes stop_codon:yes gene_type:complete
METQVIIEKTYRYLYDTAENSGTGVEYLVGGLILSSLFFLWIIKIIFNMAIPKKKDRIIVDMKMGPLEIMLKDPHTTIDLKTPIATTDATGETEIQSTFEELEEIPSETGEPKNLRSALENIIGKYAMESVTIITPEGILVDSTSDTPEVEAELIKSHLSKLEIGESIGKLEINENGLKYMFSIPQGDRHLIFLLRAKKELVDEPLNDLEIELKDTLTFIPS